MFSKKAYFPFLPSESRLRFGSNKSNYAQQSLGESIMQSEGGGHHIFQNRTSTFAFTKAQYKIIEHIHYSFAIKLILYFTRFLYSLLNFRVFQIRSTDKNIYWLHAIWKSKSLIPIIFCVSSSITGLLKIVLPRNIYLLNGYTAILIFSIPSAKALEKEPGIREEWCTYMSPRRRTKRLEVNLTGFHTVRRVPPGRSPEQLLIHIISGITLPHSICYAGCCQNGLVSTTGQP